MSDSLSPGTVPEQPLTSTSGVSRWRFSVRWLPLGVCLAGALLALAAMGSQPSFPGGFALGLLGCGLCIGALISLIVGRTPTCGGLEGPGNSTVLLAAPVLVPALQLAMAGTLTFCLLRVAVAGTWPAPNWLLGPAITGAFLWSVVSAFVVSRRLAFFGVKNERAWWEHHGLWLLGLTTLLYLPGLGSFGLVDPWESHYGEVAREMLARRDWISLWWAEDGWFWSKPILDFWAQGLSFAALGVPYTSDAMLGGVAQGNSPAPEWAARLPFFLFTLLGQHLLYVGARLHLGRRAAFFGSLILATCPQWYFLARQSMVDMLYVAPLCAAMGLLLIALGTASSVQVREHTLRWRPGSRPFVVSSANLLWGLFLVLVVPQVLYLASRNISFAWQSWPVGFFVHADQVRLGSPDNCGLPGNRACVAHAASARAVLQPLFAAGIWAIAASVLAWRNRHVRSVATLCYLGVWLFAALSFLGKGAPGLVLVLFVFLGTLVAGGRYGELKRCAPLSMVVILGCVAAPWFVQQYSRLGFGFIERLFLHDMVKRAFEHVHDTNTGVDVSFRYYVWQLGYALFPWSGVAAVGSLFCLGRVASKASASRKPTDADRRPKPDSQVAIELMIVWQLAAFGMFSITGTKFHHYILPLVPPAALLGGVFLAELWSKQEGAERSQFSVQRICRAGLVPISVAAICFGLDLALPGSLLGNNGAASVEPTIGAAVACAGFGLFSWVAFRARAKWDFSEQSSWLSLLTIAAAVLALLVGRDLASRPAGDIEGQSRLLSLFCYTYTRDWPKLIDFSGWLSALGVTAGVVLCVGLWSRVRRTAVLGIFCLAMISAAWGINVYLPQLSVHWGQRATLMKYYERRTGPEEPVVAYQLNWKGENFYTGNHINVFKVSGKKFKDWVSAQKKKGVKVMFFATEHARIPTLKRELGKVTKLEKLTDKALSSKFLMVRVEL